MTLHRIYPAFGLMFILVCPGVIAGDCPPGHASNSPYTLGGQVAFNSPVLNVDSDGAPNAYRVDGGGLSYTCDGVAAIENGRPITTQVPFWQKKCNEAWQKAMRTDDYRAVHIFGFYTNAKTGRPVVQGSSDPLPGEAYVSTTKMVVPGTPEDAQRHYVDATKIPYIVLPARYALQHNIHEGALALVFRPRTGAYTFGIFADTGGFGEASVKLHEDLGGKPLVTKGGVERATGRIDDATMTVVFPDRVVAADEDYARWNSAIASEGRRALQAFGGIDRLRQLCSATGTKSQ